MGCDGKYLRFFAVFSRENLLPVSFGTHKFRVISDGWYSLMSSMWIEILPFKNKLHVERGKRFHSETEKSFCTFNCWLQVIKVKNLSFPEGLMIAIYHYIPNTRSSFPDGFDIYILHIITSLIRGHPFLMAWWYPHIITSLIRGHVLARALLYEETKTPILHATEITLLRLLLHSQQAKRRNF